MIIQKQPNPCGAYPAPQTWNFGAIPETHAVIDLDMTEFYEYNGFVTLTIEGDTVTDYTPNVDAWEAWKAEHPDPSEPEPTTEERIAALEEDNIAIKEQLQQADDTAIELFEMQMAQEAINTAQDDALIEIYEMIGG